METVYIALEEEDWNGSTQEQDTAPDSPQGVEEHCGSSSALPAQAVRVVCSNRYEDFFVQTSSRKATSALLAAISESLKR